MENPEANNIEKPKTSPRLSRLFEKVGLRPRLVKTTSGLIRRELFPNSQTLRLATQKENLPSHYELPKMTPPFAEGRCLIIGGGDYKTVMVDNDGKSDSVIKRYDMHTYRGAGAQEKAIAAAHKIEAILEVLRKICGKQYYLPSEVKAAPISLSAPNDFAVYELQQRGVFVAPSELFDSQKVARLAEEGRAVDERFRTVALPELKRRGLIPNHLQEVSSESRGFYPKKWDLLSQSLVVDDVIDWLWWER